MKLGLYLNTNKVGLQFGTEKDRDTFWNAMGAKANGGADESAEKFGQRSIRLHPEHFKARLMWTMDIQVLSPEVVSPVTEIKVPAGSITAPAKLEPVAIIKEPAPAPEPQPQPQPQPPVPTLVAIDEISTLPVTEPIREVKNLDIEPLDKRTKLWRAWNARNSKNKK